MIEATDSTGLSTRARHVVTLSPVSATGKLFTVLGTPNPDGLHWVITGDGFTADQQQDLLRAALAMARSLTDAPELARHSGVLNVHVLSRRIARQRRGDCGRLAGAENRIRRAPLAAPMSNESPA